MTKKRKEKLRHQVKSRFYYLFWGAATVSVFIGQLYVGTGYRSFARSLNRIFDTIYVEVHKGIPDIWDHPNIIPLSDYHK